MKDPARIALAQAPALAALEELTDITSNSISGKDKIIASRAVDAIKDFVVGYLALKGRAEKAWFQIGEGIRDNPDFVAMDPESLRELEADKTWLEWKALRQYLGIYAEAQSDMPDINYLIAIDTRKPERSAWRVILPEAKETLVTVSLVADVFVPSFTVSVITAAPVEPAHMQVAPAPLPASPRKASSLSLQRKEL
jgi:hypothetical protein